MKDTNEMKRLIEEQKKIINEINKAEASLIKIRSKEERIFINKHISDLKKKLEEINESLINELKLNEKSVTKKLPKDNVRNDIMPKVNERGNVVKISKKLSKENRPVGLEKETIKRIKWSDKAEVELKEKKPSQYISLANRIFGKMSNDLAKENFFRKLKRDLIQANLQFLPANYIATTIFSVLISFLVSVFIVLFLLFFNITSSLPIIHLVEEPFLIRFAKIFWIMIAIPLSTLLVMYFYPNLEKRNIAYRIDQELPFATINMSAISGSMIDPTRIFSIIISTGEYPFLEKEFTKIINEINVYGYNLVAALRRVAFNSPSKKLSDLLNGLATTITSGGDMPEFFNKRSQSLLFEYRLEREKYTRAAETFMDIYISVVIASPMIIMLLLMMMRVSGLGISLSTAMLSLVMVLGVTSINFVFLLFLHLKQPTN
jgi:hypothetical protein